MKKKQPHTRANAKPIAAKMQNHRDVVAYIFNGLKNRPVNPFDKKYLAPLRELTTRIEIAMSRQMATRTEVDGIREAMNLCEPLHRLAIGWSTREIGEFLLLDKKVTELRDRVEGTLGRHIFGAITGSDDFKSAAWFERNTTIRADSLRQAVRKGKPLRTGGTRARKTYSKTDAIIIWGRDSFLKTPA